MSPKECLVSSPATVANLGCGFDIMGLAIQEPLDRIGVKFNGNRNIRISEITGPEGHKLSFSARENLMIHVLHCFTKKLGTKQGMDITLEKHVPLSSGMGSSAASSGGVLVAANALFDNPFNNDELVTLAMEGEKFISGAWHADNVAPCIMGGLVVIPNYDPLSLVSCPFPEDLIVVVVHPHFELPTKLARAALPKEIPLGLAVKQWGHVAAYVSSFFLKDKNGLARYMEDFVIEPARAALIPGFYDVKNAALENGAIGCSIAGGGPSVFAFTFGRDQADMIASQMALAFKKHQIECDKFFSPVNPNGCHLIN